MGTIAVPFFIGEPMPGFEVPEPHRVLDPVLPAGSPQARMAVLYRELAAAVAAEDDPVVYAGDCLAVLGVTAGLQRAGRDPTVIWFDAHGDFHTWDTTASGFLGGMPLAMLVGRGEQTIAHGAGLTPLPEDRVILVDGRDLDPGEDEALAGSDVLHLTVEELAHRVPPAGDLYVHVDVDVVDPADMPAVNYPTPDGPDLTAVRTALIHLAVGGRVVGFSVSAWNPALPGAPAAARATATLAAPFLA